MVKHRKQRILYIFVRSFYLICLFKGIDTGHTGNSSLPTHPQYGGRDGPLQVRGVFQEGVRNHHGSHQGQQGVLAQVAMVILVAK